MTLEAIRFGAAVLPRLDGPGGESELRNLLEGGATRARGAPLFRAGDKGDAMYLDWRVVRPCASASKMKTRKN